MCDVICLVLVGFCFEIKKIAFVLSCLKWIYNLLPINQLQSEKNSLFNTFSIFSASVLIKDTGIVRKDQVLFNACGKLFIYITKRSGPKMDPRGTSQFISPASEKTPFSVSKNFLHERYDWN